MDNATRMGSNRTGMQMAPIEGSKTARIAEQTPPESAIGGLSFADLRQQEIEASDAIGSVPLPGSLSGAVSTIADKLGGTNPEVLIDKLGERLAYERSSARLYEALLDKVEALGGETAMLMAERLRHFRDEEIEHFDLVRRMLEEIGADPTAQTPCADTSALASIGIMQVLTDPRTTIAQGLNAMQTAELTDNAGWELLIGLARHAGQNDMADRFEQALMHEQEHLITVKRWLEQRVLAEIG